MTTQAQTTPLDEAQGLQRKGEPYGKVRAEKYEIDVAFEPHRSFLRAKATVTLRASEPVETLEFELNPRLEIKEITDAQGRKLGWDRSKRLGSPKLLVRLAEPAAAEFSLTFTYEGAPLLGGLDYITKDGILLRDESRWYPAVDLSAFTQNDIRVAPPRAWFVLTSGERQPFTPGQASVAQRWITSHPVSSRSIFAFPGTLECTAVECEEKLLDLVCEVRVCQRYPAKGPPIGVTRKNSAIASYYARVLGPMSARELWLVPGFPGQRGAIGYSGPGFLVVSEDVVKFAGDPNYVPEFLPHEIAHQWFPIEVTLAQAEDGWLAESLAEYLAWRYLQEKQPVQARAMVARAMRDALAPDPLPPLDQGLRMFALHEWNVTHASLYQRGMLVWRTLETVIGRSRVDAALREYYKRFAGRSASVANFHKICEEISGRELGWFFDYFLHGTEIPEIELRRLSTVDPNEYAAEILLKNVPPEFTVRVEMKLHTSAGVVDHSVATNGLVTRFALNVPGGVTRVVLDPDARILQWSEAARRNRTQRALLTRLGEHEEDGEIAEAIALCQQALELESGELTGNAQLLFFQLGRLHFRLGQWAKAREALRQVFESRSLDSSVDAFYRAWAHVWLARIAQRQGRVAQARREAAEGLKLPAAALETRIQWPGAAREQSAREALRAIAGVK